METVDGGSVTVLAATSVYPEFARKRLRLVACFETERSVLEAADWQHLEGIVSKITRQVG